MVINNFLAVKVVHAQFEQIDMIKLIDLEKGKLKDFFGIPL